MPAISLRDEGGLTLSKRTYKVALENPVSDPCEKCGTKELTWVLEVPSVTTVTEARGISWSLLYSAVNHTKAGRDYREEWRLAAERGTDTHSLAEDLVLYGL